MSLFLAHVESVTSAASGAVLSGSGQVVQNLVTAPCSFHNNPFLSWRLFYENKDTLALIYTISSALMAALVLTIFLLLLLRRKKIFVSIALGVLLLVLLATGTLRFLEGERAGFGNAESNHLHSDIALWINGEKFNLGNGKYISSEESTLSNYAHIHDSQGSVLHVHATGVTYGYALETLGITFDEKCLILDQEKKSYCAKDSDGTHLSFYLNSKKVENIRERVINDLDKLSIIFGPEEEPLQQEIHKEITDNACLYSEKCTDRMFEKEVLGCSGEN
ncbi:MAG: hypothetical protein ACK4NC_05265 [Candidatus Gracilibacteria bacterium]